LGGTELIKKVVRVRVRFLKRYVDRLRYVALLLTISFIILASVKWLILYPYFNRLILLAQIGDVSGIERELSNMPTTVIYSPLIYCIGLILLTLSCIYIVTILHATLKIQYSMVLDSARLLQFFSLVTGCISALLWAGLFHAFIKGNPDTIIYTARSIYFAERMCRLCFSTSTLVFSYSLFKLRGLIARLYSQPSIIVTLLFILNVVSIIDVIFTLPFYLYLYYRRKIINVYAYADIEKLEVAANK